ncbi:hypothetical protein V2J09_003765 [Rumex salicifolius]
MGRRSRKMLHTTREEGLASNKHDMIQKTVEKIKKGRMEGELDDYSPTGPNPYHTPKPPHG